MNFQKHLPEFFHIGKADCVRGVALRLARIEMRLHEDAVNTDRDRCARKQGRESPVAVGFIVGIPGADDALSLLAKSDIPTVVMNVADGGIERRERRIAFVKSDSTAVGREAANALLKQGVYKSYGYTGYRTDDDWSRERGRAFRDALDEAGFVGRMMDIAHYRDKVEDKSTVEEWL